MLKVAFIDTGYMRALLDRKDSLHSKAVVIDVDAYGRRFTSEFVLTELLAAFSKSQRQREAAVTYVEYLKTQPSVEIEPASAQLFRRAFELFKSRPDKTWSLIDCSSFIIMEDNRIEDALTGDDDFRQAGFKPMIC
jgi:hypothetical protein